MDNDNYNKLLEKVKVPEKYYQKVQAIKLLDKLRIIHQNKSSKMSREFKIRFNNVETIEKQRREYQSVEQIGNDKTRVAELKSEKHLDTFYSLKGKEEDNESLKQRLEVREWDIIQEICESFAVIDNRNLINVASQSTEALTQILPLEFIDGMNYEKMSSATEDENKPLAAVPSELLEQFFQSLSEEYKDISLQNKPDSHLTASNEGAKTAKQKISPLDQSLISSIVLDNELIVEEAKRKKIEEKENIFSRFVHKKPRTMSFLKSETLDLSMTTHSTTLQSFEKIEKLSEKFKLNDIKKKFEIPLQTSTNNESFSRQGTSKLQLKPKNEDRFTGRTNHELNQSFLSGTSVQTYLDDFCKKNFID